ncbi:hypothetical protein G7Y89_g9543 [Cudoniella acicularis]|uniref:Fe2OG dioxygenase domain-containing protein n=1 Tax=Cudoniella acicularis TaxID=354080 RepID=A0A8H4RFF5_9HELO|nr:hypothetical protein G7Y89_g9543 [Cudoniella acicularis]
MGSIEREQKAPQVPEDSPISIPIIDFLKWTSRSSDERAAVAKELADACHNVGFVFIVNHGVTPELLEGAFGWSKRLFDLKTEEKMLAPHPDGPTVHRGYSWPGLEKVSQVISSDFEVGEKLRVITDCKESYEIGSEENDEQPNVWLPDEVFPGFRKFMTDFYWECSRASREILTAIGTGMGLKDPEFMLKFHSGHNNQLRLLHYPPIPAAQLENESSARMPAHSDWGSITMLFQDDCGGLEVENQRVPGQFVKVTPIKNAIVMNIGDLLMRLFKVNTSSSYTSSCGRSLHRYGTYDESEILDTIFQQMTKLLLPQYFSRSGWHSAVETLSQEPPRGDSPEVPLLAHLNTNHQW